jgi:hypothetical protein
LFVSAVVVAVVVNAGVGGPKGSTLPALTGGPPTPYGPAGVVPNGRIPKASCAPSSNPVGIAVTRLPAVTIGLGK